MQPSVTPSWPLAAVLSLVSSVDAQSLRVENPALHARQQVACATVPFARGQEFAPLQMNVAGQPTAWRVLQTWEDGSVRLAQAQFHEALAGAEVVHRDVREGGIAPAPFSLHPAVAASAAGFFIESAVTDPYGVEYRATVAPLSPLQPVDVLEDTALRRTLRMRAYHRAGPGEGIGRDYLSQTTYVTFFSGEPYAVVDLIVANDYLGADRPASAAPNLHPLGDVAFELVRARVGGVAASLRHHDLHEAGPVRQVGGAAEISLLGASYLADGQGKRWRFVVEFGGPVAAGHVPMSSTCTAMARAELLAVTEHAAWHRSEAIGPVGGPVAPPHDAQERMDREHREWRSAEWFGPFGAWGETQSAVAGGSPHNGPITDPGAHVAQTGSCLPFEELEAIAFQQTLRPIHLWGLRIGPTDDILTWNGLPHTLTSQRQISAETLGRRALQQNDRYKRYRVGVPIGEAHGWDGLDMEHLSLDALYDYWVLTGDHRTRDEIMAMAEVAMGASRPFKYRTRFTLPARAEGWLAQAMVKAWLATGDVRYRDHIVHRIEAIVAPQQPDHPSRALVFQSDYPGTRFPMPHKFYLAWQHAAVVYGYLGVWREFGNAMARRLAHDAVHVVEHSWVRGYWDPVRGFVEEGLRYVTPVEFQGQPIPADYWDHTPGVGVHWGEGPLFGSARFLVSALDLIDEDADDRELAERARVKRLTLMTPAGPLDDRWRWMRWCLLRETPQLHEGAER